ncbi:MAG: MFS transporter [Christensenellales bacterium]|nr:hypothetical protein [Clostridiales bacterium]
MGEDLDQKNKKEEDLEQKNDINEDGTIALDINASEQKEKTYVPKKEIIWYGIAAAGQGMIYAIMSSYISDFYISVAMFPPLFVLLIMIFARVWDAINDPLMGIIADKITPKKGKYKMYSLFTPIPLIILTFLMFYIPKGFQGPDGLILASKMTGAMAYAGIVYILWGMTFTVSDVPFWSMPNTMTPNAKERGNIIAIGRTINGIGSAVPMAAYMLLGFILPHVIKGKTELEFNRIQYLIITLFCAVLGGGLFIISAFTTKERVIIPKEDTKKRKPGEPSVLKRIFTCKPLMLVVLAGVLSCGRYLVQVAAIHVARYSIYIGPDITNLAGDALTAALSKSRSTVSMVLNVCSAVGMFGAMVFMPALFKKFNYKQILIVSCIGGFISNLLAFFVGWYGNFWGSLPFFVISAIPLGVLNIVLFAMIGDCLDFIEWKTGYRENALGSSLQSFVNKLGNAIATASIIVVFMIMAIDPAQMVEASGTFGPHTLNEAKRRSIFALVSIAPGVSMLLATIPLFFYDIVGEKKEKILSELAIKRAERGIDFSEK